VNLFATPLDAERVMVRRAPETYLWVRAADAVGRVAVSVDLRASQPPLRPAEVDALHPYFEWPRGRHAFDWFTTARPAYFRLLRVREDVYVGHLVERGKVQGVPGSAAAPAPRGEELRRFRAYRPAQAKAESAVVEDPRVRDAGKRLRQVYRSPLVEGWVARFPHLGMDPVWLRAYAEGAFEHFDPRLFQAEERLLRLLDEDRPGAAVRVAHLGTLEAGTLRGPYLATTVPLGVEPGALFRSAREFAPEAAWQLAADLLLTLEAAHRRDMCLGALSPPLLRARPSYVAHRAVVRVQLAAAPLAGAAGQPVRLEDHRRLPAEALPPHWPAPAGVRSPAADVADAGRLLARMLDEAGVEAPALRAEAAVLAEGRVPSADEALARLAAAFPDVRDRFLAVLRPRARRAR
jgi:hypothetical protein